MIKGCRHPGKRGMAEIAFRVGNEMTRIFAGGRAAIVAVTTAANQIAVVKCRRYPAKIGMTGIAFGGGNNVVGWFAFSDGAIVARLTVTNNLGVINPADIDPGIVMVTTFARLGGGNVIDGLRRGVNHSV